MSLHLKSERGAPDETVTGRGSARPSGTSPALASRRPAGQGNEPRIRKVPGDVVGLGAVAVATIVTYTIFMGVVSFGSLIHTYPHTPLPEFLAMFARNNADAWPVQVIWYVAAVAMVGLAVSQLHRSSQVVCLLLAAYFAWIGIGYFAWLNPQMSLSWAWASVFTLQAVLLLVAGVARNDLVIRPRRDLTSLLGAAFIFHALVLYPVIGVLGGHPLRMVPVFGLSPCATVIFFFGFMLWARPPVPKHLLLVPLAWALCAAPPDLATGVVADVGMVVAGVTTAAVIIWRDRVSDGRTLAECLLLALMIVWSGHDDVLIGLAIVFLALMGAEVFIGLERAAVVDPGPGETATRSEPTEHARRAL